MVTAHVPAHSESTIGAYLVSAAVVGAAMLALYLVGFDQGALSGTGMFLHELMHDGRHLLGVPCH
ncbi:CbtB-domain containing protein [Hoyosella sp. YIM 151337]|uniref:CbtB-domain containing protein n=1 Tax=Hoyosella sp. YIM 151337 TaxID=2992742 RepID=UPI002236359D|nr:CbtB-domain containing protein [Hoyosella sp. YIM 151337]MCW4352790.1 CbtB-domain containing protein [Hoyosella sp. YIM 151337]